MITIFVAIEHPTFRTFLDTKGIKHIDDHPNMTGVTVQHEHELFYLGMAYEKHLTETNTPS